MDAIRDGGGSGGETRALRVLALDGGAIRGYYTARVIERLIAGAGGDPERVDIGAGFDLIVGTSAGAILGASLAAGVPVTRVCSLYRTDGPAIFRDPAPTGWTTLLWATRHWRPPPANAGALRRVLDETMGNETLRELLTRRGIALCVTTTDLVTSRARIIGTPHRAVYDGDGGLRLVEVCLASAAAPMLLPPAAIGDDDAERWCDGGVWAATPLWVALAEALALAGERPIDIVSLGTCAVPLGMAVTRERAKSLGFWTRGVRALQLSTDAQTSATLDLLRALVPHLRERVRVMRVADPEPDAEQAARLHLDDPSPAAFAAMDALAERAIAMCDGAPDDVGSAAALLRSLAVAAA